MSKAAFQGVVTAQRRLRSSGAEEMYIGISGSGRTSLLDAWHAFYPSGTRVSALPGWEKARLLIPAGTPRERWIGSRLYPAYRFRAKAFRMLLRAAAALSLLPARTVEEEGWPLKPVLMEHLPETQTVSLLVGTPGIGQKLTAESRDANGRVVGYLKYAEGAVAKAQLHNEADVLKALPPSTGPVFIAVLPFYRGLLLVTRPVPGRPVPAALPPPPGLIEFARTLLLSDREPIYEHPWVHRTRAAEHLPTALRALDKRLWNVAIQHGDLAAWNIRMTDTGIRAFDWEYGTLQGFPYLDLTHFVLQHAALIAHWPPERAASAAANYIRSASNRELSRPEAVAIVQLGAYDAFLNDQAPNDSSLQQWRQRIWQRGA